MEYIPPTVSRPTVDLQTRRLSEQLPESVDNVPFIRPPNNPDGPESVHSLGILPGSSLKFKDQVFEFGDDPPTSV